MTSAEDLDVYGEDLDGVAAVDLGSNSFHMVIARVVGDDLRIVDRIKERVRLAAGLDSSKRLTEEAQERALECLRRFGERLHDMPDAGVRAVGTNTLRKAKNSEAFLARARKALGVPIEVVSGREEARLVYLGVSHSLSDDAGRRLVVDIGGGSTECILGERFEALEAESLHMGCVSFTQRFFPDGALTREAFRAAGIAAQVELQTIQRRFQSMGWDTAAGSSGTLQATAEVLRSNGWGEQITKAGLRKLRKALVASGSLSKVELEGLKPERLEVFPGGLAIVEALFDCLEIESMSPAKGALREGVLYDLLGRIRHEDVRDRTTRLFERRHQVDVEQAARVERTALKLLGEVGQRWKLQAPRARALLVWAARLHEVGMTIAYSNHHKHGAYIVTHSDMPGFSNDGKRALAALIRGQRRKFNRAIFEDLMELGAERHLRLCLLLRLAVLFNRSRSARTFPKVEIKVRKRQLIMAFPSSWLDQNALTRVDLEIESGLWERVGYDLQVEAV